MPAPAAASLNVPTGQDLTRASNSSDFSISQYLGGSEPNSPIDGSFGLTTGRTGESPGLEGTANDARLTRRRSTSSNASSDGQRRLSASLSAPWEGRGHKVSQSASSSADLGSGRPRWQLEEDGQGHLKPATSNAQYADYRYATPPPRSTSATSPSRTFYDPVANESQAYGLQNDHYHDDDLHEHDATPVDERDIAGLTSNMAFSPRQGYDVEATSRSPRQRGGRRSFSYHPTSPVGRRRSILESAAREIRRASIRVVNFAGRDGDRNAAHLRLPNNEGSMDIVRDEPVAPMDEDVPVQEEVTPMQGRSLGIFGPKHPVRRWARAFLLWPCVVRCIERSTCSSTSHSATEPIILALIIINVIIVAIQSAPNVYTTPRPAGPGYFNTWEDYVLFVLMVIFRCARASLYVAHCETRSSVEIAARIIVSGFLFAPTHRPGQVMAHRFNNAPFLPDSMRKKPAGYPPKTLSDSYEMSEKAAYMKRHSSSFADLQRAKTTIHQHSPPPPRTHPKGVSIDHTRMAPIAQGQEAPFQLAVAHQHFVTNTNAAYLRHSWNRLDLLAVSSFWVAFVLAMGGWESTEHVYLFRMLSVLRAARLLTITAGTTVCLFLADLNVLSGAQTILHSLKKAAPLLVTVAFFVLFAMVLFR